MSTDSNALFRVDRFVVPAEAYEPFMARVRHIDQTLGAQPGCRQNLVLVSAGEGGEHNVVTLVEWASTQAIDNARAVVHKMYAEEGFDPPAFMRQIGVRADMGLYRNA